MTKIQVYIINAFVDSGKGGNPAGVVLDADLLDRDTKQHIAARIGISETAFISKSQTADFRLDFFTPTRQIPHCGHATIAAFVFLVQQGRLEAARSSKETIDGRREVILSEDMAFMEQTAPRYTRLADTPISREDVLSSLRLAASDLMDRHEPAVVNTGNSFLLVPLKNRAVLRDLKPDFPAVEKISQSLDLIGYYPFSTEVFVPGRHATARMFAPWYGIQEEAATGMAAGPLACYLHDAMGFDQQQLIIEQGFLMDPASPSEIRVNLTLKDGRIEKLMAGGRAEVSRVVEIEI